MSQDHLSEEEKKTNVFSAFSLPSVNISLHGALTPLHFCVLLLEYRVGLHSDINREVPEEKASGSTYTSEVRSCQVVPVGIWYNKAHTERAVATAAAIGGK